MFARGAEVVRVADVAGPTDGGELEVVLRGLPLLLEPGSLRGVAEGRQVLAVTTAVEVPDVPAIPGDPVVEVRTLARQKRRLDEERRSLEARRAALLALAPVLRPPGGGEPMGPRLADALAAGALGGRLLEEADARLVALARRAAELEEALAVAQVRLAQATSGARRGTGHPERLVRVRLSAGAALEALRVRYTVPAARWWPAYALRITEGGRRARWALEAHVAQRSGEDWRGVRLALSTAELVSDARLPELASLRLGRRKPEPKRGYRPAPGDLDAMFAGYDAAFPAAPPPPPPPMQPPMPAFQPMPPPAMAPMPVMAAPMMIPPTGAAAPPRLEQTTFGAVPGGPPMPQAARGGRARQAAAPESARAHAVADAPMEAPPELAEPAAIEPEDDWLDFDALVLGGPQVARRGRLGRTSVPQGADARGAAERAVDAAASPKLRDPRDTRGAFDSRHEVAGTVDLPSDARAVRVRVGEAEARSRTVLRTVPREVSDVFRAVELVSPFDAPLLGGPVDVYVEGTLLSTTEVDHVDRGGTLRVGTGVEERVRVVRNVEVAEESAGLLGGSVAVTHRVTIELESALGHACEVEVRERVPVTDDKKLEIELLDPSPRPTRVEKRDDGQPLRGGWSFRVPLGPGARGVVRYAYKLELPAKLEVVGGNRRE